MIIKKVIKWFIESLGYKITKQSTTNSNHKVSPQPIYDQDSLCTSHNHDFMSDPMFITAYQRGLKTCDKDHILLTGGPKHQIHWRVHVALWAASHAKLLEGDFVECGVDRGIFSSSIMAYLNWNSLNKQFFLFDTFCGIDERYLNEEEKKQGRMEFSKRYYPECYEATKANFAEFKRVHLVRGSVPDTLSTVTITKICYLSIDMNCAKPEIEAAIFFWDKIVSGGIVLLDDYAYVGYDEQKKAFDKFAVEKGIKILSIPTGQGLFIKP